METLWKDLRHTLRMMRKAPVFTAVAVLVLALGIGANTAIFSLVEGFLLHPMPMRNAGRLVWLSETSAQVHRMPLSVPDLTDWQHDSHVFSGVAGIATTSFTVLGHGRPQRLLGDLVTGNFFSVLGVAPELGRTLQPSDDHAGAAPVVVVTHQVWSDELGSDPNIVGKGIDLGGREYTVVGVLPASFRLNLGMQALVPMREEFSTALQQARGARPGIDGIARLKPGVTLAQAQTAMSALARRLQVEYPETNSGIGASVEPLRHFLTGTLKPALLLLMAAVGLVLLIACANLASLLLARSVARQKEIAIRLALGAPRRRLGGQLLTETTVLSVLGGAFGVVFAGVGVRIALALLPEHVPLGNQVGLNLSVLLFTLAVAIGTGILFGLAPAIQATRMDINRALVDGGRQSASGNSHRLHRGLIVAEVALTMVLLIGAGLLLRSFRQLRDVNPGINPTGVLTAEVDLPGMRYRTPSSQAEFFQQVLRKLRTMPGMQAAGAILPLPFVSGGWNTSYAVAGTPTPPTGHAPSTDFGVVTPGYFQTMRVPLLRGRFFSASDNATSPRVAIVDASFARRTWPHQNPIGQHIKVDTGNFGDASQPVLTVVGVVGHTMNYGLDGTRRVETYVPYLQDPVADMALVVRANGGSQAGLAAIIRNAVQAVDPQQPAFDILPMSRVVQRTMASRRLALDLLSALAALALLLASVGLYGVISFSVNQRTQEIGIRMAIGASRTAVLRMVLFDGARLAFLGVTAGLAAGLMLSRAMGSMLYGVQADDPLTYATVAATLLLVAIVSALVPALRATQVDPMIALRSE